MTLLSADHLAFSFGLLGDVVSFMVFLAPIPTFYRICKKKSTEGFQSIPYSVALFSATLTLYYGLLKPNGLMLVTINTIGCAIEGTYLTIYMIFGTKGTKVYLFLTVQIYTTKLLFLFNMMVFGAILAFTFFLAKRPKRITIVGWICVVFSVCVYAAPLSIMRKVIKIKSVEFMPFTLSFFLTLCATMWFFYGLLVKVFFIALQNVLGFLFGISQIMFYLIYKTEKQCTLPEHQLQEVVTGDELSKPQTAVDPIIDISTGLKEARANGDARDKSSEATESNA